MYYRPSEIIEGKKALILSLIVVIVMNIIVAGIEKIRQKPNSIEPEIQNTNIGETLSLLQLNNKNPYANILSSNTKLDLANGLFSPLFWIVCLSIIIFFTIYTLEIIFGRFKSSNKRLDARYSSLPQTRTSNAEYCRF